MKICGIEINSSVAKLAVLDLSADGVLKSLVVTSLELKDSECTEQVIKLKWELEHFFGEHNAIEKVFLKKRIKKGRCAGGADSFKIEGLVQISSPVDIVFVTSHSITASQKKEELIIDIPLGLHKNKNGAFLTAIVGLQKNPFGEFIAQEA